MEIDLKTIAKQIGVKHPDLAAYVRVARALESLHGPGAHLPLPCRMVGVSQMFDAEEIAAAIPSWSNERVDQQTPRTARDAYKTIAKSLTV